jgi:hypothetical protein
MFVHIKAIPQQMRLMSPPLPKTLKLRLVEVVFQNRHIVGVRTLLDNNPRTLSRAQTTHVRKTLLGNNDVEIVLRLVNVRAHGHDTGYTRRIGLGGAGRRRVHDGVFCASKEIGGAAEAVEHTASHYAGGVCVGIDVDFDWGVHPDDTKATDDLRAVGNCLGAEKEFGGVLVPVLVETLETVGREAD